MANKQTYSFITTISARTEDDAESAREECGGGIEDARESGYFPDGTDVDAGELVAKDLDEVLDAYRDFHDKLSDMVEDGRFVGFKDAHPDDYRWMVDMMAEIAGLDAKDAREIAAEG